MEYSTTQENGTVVVKLETKRATHALAGDFRDELLGHIGEGRTRFVVDLSASEFVDSSFLGALVTGLKRSTAEGGDVKIVGLQPPVRAMFELTRLFRIFDIYETTDEALNAKKQ